MFDLAEKQRLTRDALRDFTRSLPASAYDVRIIPRGQNSKPMPRLWSAGVLLSPSTIHFLRAANADGSDIFIRPDFANYVLVDFDEDGDRRWKAMRDDGVPVALAVLTSPDHVQAWIDIGPMRDVTEAESAEAARILARRYGGDMRATGRKQLGRAPGFFNRKPKYRDEHGHFPRVQIIHARPGPRAAPILMEARATLARAPAGATGVNFADEWSDPSETDSEPIMICQCGQLVATMSAPPKLGHGKEAFDNALHFMTAQGYRPPRRADGDVDRSRRDIDVAMFMLYCDILPDAVIDDISTGSDKAKERMPDHAQRYAGNRINQAMKRLSGHQLL